MKNTRSGEVYIANLEPAKGSEQGRSGQWGLPFHTDKDTVYQGYVSAARMPLELKYDGVEESVLGLDTLRFVVDTTSAPMGIDDTATGLPLVVDAKITIWVEPNTGAAVKADDLETVSALAPSGAKFLRFQADVSYSGHTVETLVADTSSDRDQIVRLGTYLPWRIIGVGIVLLLVAGWLWYRGRPSTSAASARVRSTWRSSVGLGA